MRTWRVDRGPRFSLSFLAVQQRFLFFAIQHAPHPEMCCVATIGLLGFRVSKPRAGLLDGGFGSWHLTAKLKPDVYDGQSAQKVNTLARGYLTSRASGVCHGRSDRDPPWGEIPASANETGGGKTVPLVFALFEGVFGGM